MSIGRPPSWLIGGTAVFVDTRDLDARGRVTLPPHSHKELPWLTPGTPVLGVLEDHGRIRLLPWSEATLVMQRIEELKNALGTGENAVADELLLLQDRYCRLSVEPMMRVQLPQTVVLHLVVDFELPTAVFIARYPNHIELWGWGYRERRLERAARESGDLP